MIVNLVQHEGEFELIVSAEMLEAMRADAQMPFLVHVSSDELTLKPLRGDTNDRRQETQSSESDDQISSKRGA